jgi:hypothetical protein
MKFKVTDIKWNTESDGVVRTAEELRLPLETVIEADEEDDVADELSDKFGFCILSFGSALDLSDEDTCPETKNGKHVPDWNSITISQDGDELYIDISCEECGQSGCVGNKNTLVAGINW